MDRLTEHADGEEDARNVTIEQIEVLGGLSIRMTLYFHITITYRHSRKLEFLLRPQRKERLNDWTVTYPNKFDLIGCEQQVERFQGSSPLDPG